MRMPSDLVPSISIENLIGQRDAIVDRLQRAAALFGEVTSLLEVAIGEHNSCGPALYCRRSNAGFPDGLERVIKRVDADFWDKLMGESGLWSFMDHVSREQWRRDINEVKVPELTAANIEETFRELFARRRAMFERGVIECFRKLSWDYRTNSPVMFGKRVILTYVLDGYKRGSGRMDVFGPHQVGCDKLDDLIRVMSVLDGKPEPDHRQGAYCQLREHIGYNRPIPTEPIELGGLISIRVYRNCNGHVTFLRPDLVDRLNAIIADHYPGALPPARE